MKPRREEAKKHGRCFATAATAITRKRRVTSAGIGLVPYAVGNAGLAGGGAAYLLDGRCDKKLADRWRSLNRGHGQESRTKACSQRSA